MSKSGLLRETIRYLEIRDFSSCNSVTFSCVLVLTILFIDLKVFKLRFSIVSQTDFSHLNRCSIKSVYNVLPISSCSNTLSNISDVNIALEIML